MTLKKHELYILIALFVACCAVGAILVFLINGINQEAAQIAIQDMTIRAIQRP